MLGPTPTDFVSMAGALPSSPDVIAALGRMELAPSYPLRTALETANMDPSLVWRALKRANDGTFRIPHPCAALRDAAKFLGETSIRALLPALKEPDASIDVAFEASLDYAVAWRRSRAMAWFARALAKMLDLADPEIAWTAGLCADLGMLAIYERMGPTYVQSARLRLVRHRAILEFEQRLLGFDHALVSAELLRALSFPEPFIGAVQWHHDAESAPESCRALARLLEVSTVAACTVIPIDAEGTAATTRIRANEWFYIDSGRATVLLARLGAFIDDPASPLRSEVIQETPAESRAEPVSATPTLPPFAADPLTGLGTVDALQPALAAACGSSIAQTFVHVDVDRLDEVNRTHGNEIGDALLAAIARALERTGPAGSLIARLGGDDLALLVPNCTRTEASRIAESVRASVAAIRIRSLAGCEVGATVSIGVVTLDEASPPSLRSPAAVRLVAERAASAAGSSGGNSIRMFRPRPSAA